MSRWLPSNPTTVQFVSIMFFLQSHKNCRTIPGHLLDAPNFMWNTWQHCTWTETGQTLDLMIWLSCAHDRRGQIGDVDNSRTFIGHMWAMDRPWPTQNQYSVSTGSSLAWNLFLFCFLDNISQALRTLLVKKMWCMIQAATQAPLHDSLLKLLFHMRLRLKIAPAVWLGSSVLPATCHPGM